MPATYDTIVGYLLTRRNSLSKMRLMKLAYFGDLMHVERYGQQGRFSNGL